MILVDSSVWIDFFRGATNPATEQLVKLLKAEQVEADVGVADLVIYEVMRGFNKPKDRQRAKELLLDIAVVEIGGLDNALLAVEHYNVLRQNGYTIRSPIDVLLASYCITHGHMLLHRDVDFDAIETLRGLKSWPH
jgi:predicted nucleic acid-binding protein